MSTAYNIQITKREGALLTAHDVARALVRGDVIGIGDKVSVLGETLEVAPYYVKGAKDGISDEYVDLISRQTVAR